MSENIIISNIKALCEKKDITVSILEKQLDFSTGLISRWNKSSPSIDKITAIADYFDVSVDFILGRTKDQSTTTIEDTFMKKLIEDTKSYLIGWIDSSCEKENILDEDNLKFAICQLNTDSFYGGSIISNLYFEYFSSIIYCLSYVTQEIEDYAENHPPMKYTVLMQTNKNKNTFVNNVYLISGDTPESKKLHFTIEKYLASKDTREQACMIMNSFISQNNNKSMSSDTVVDNDLIKISARHSKKYNNYDEFLDENLRQLSETNSFARVSHMTGNVLYDIKNQMVVAHEATAGITSKSKEFYQDNKEQLGEIISAKGRNGCQVFLISNAMIMKFAGFSFGKNCGMVGYNGMLDILKEAGFDVSDQSFFDNEEFTIYK